jgi:hypothetical protein
MTRTAAIGFGMAWAMSLLGGMTHAALITYQFGGQITGISDPAGVWAGRLQVGDPFAGTYVIDASTPDLDPSSSGYYVSASAEMRISVGGVQIVLPASDCWITVWNTPPGSTYYDGIDFNGATYRSGEWWVEELGAEVRDSTCTRFSSDALPLESFDIGPFDNRFFVFAGRHGPSQPLFGLEGVVTYLTVPEPATAGLAMLIVLAWLGRRDVGRALVRKA